jgi:uncharacterized repeat protein (TIGR01451 family)
LRTASDRAGLYRLINRRGHLRIRIGSKEKAVKQVRMAVALTGMLAALAVPASAGAQVGGPVILGGDDLTDHGSTDSAGVSQQGWLYMERAVGNVKSQVGRANDNSIAAFGSADPGPLAHPTGGDAGAGIKNAAEKNGMTVVYFDTATEISSGFAAIAGGTYNPAIVWIAGTGAANNLDGCEGAGTEGQAITDNAGVINNFVNSGGGLFSHGTCYGWLSALLPGLTTVDGGGADDLYRTPEGLSAFPNVTDADFNAGPWHNHFEGDFGGLNVLVRSNAVDDTSGTDAAVVIGGGQVSLTERPADLAITKVDSADPSRAGRNLTYTIAVTNNGANPATGVTVTDTLPSGLSARSSTASQGSCSGTTTVTCAVGDLAVGASATVTIVVRPTSAGTITNSASVTGNQPDPNLANNSATQETTISAAPAGRVDRTRPRVSVAGVQASGCSRAAFTATIRIRDASRMRRVVVTVDGRTLRRTRSKRFSVSVPANNMRAGRHTLRVLAVDARGNRRTVSRTFRRCAPPVIAPVFTG